MAAWETIDRALAFLGIRFGAPTTGSTVGGTHTPGSEHYEGRARDYGASSSDPAAIAQALVPYATGPNAVVDELFYSPLNIFLDKGRAFTPDAKLRQGHYGHVHVGLVPGGDLFAVVSSSPAAAAPGGTELVETPGASGGGGAWGGVRDLARTAVFTVAFVGAGVAMLALGAHRSVGGGAVRNQIKGALT